MNYSANILVIDNNESTRGECVQTLTEASYRAQAVRDGICGLDMINEESFDVVILELRLPRLGGMEILKRIKKNDPDAMVIVISGSGTIDTAVEAMRHGACDFLAKPFTQESLLAAVARAASSRHRVMENVCADSHLGAEAGADVIIGRSPPMLNITHSSGRSLRQIPQS